MKFNFSILFVLFLFVSCTNFNKMYEIVEIDENFKNGSIELAKVQIDDYLKTHSNNEYAWTLKGYIYSDLYEYTIAKESYQKALDINSKTVEALTGLGIVSRLQQNYDEAEQYYLKAIKIDPKYAYAYSSLVTVMIQNKEFKKAVEYGQKGFDLEKNDPVIAANLAVAYHYFGNTTKKLKYYKIAEDLGYDNLQSIQDIFDGKIILFE